MERGEERLSWIVAVCASGRWNGGGWRCVCVCAYVGMFYATSGPSAANNLCSAEKESGVGPANDVDASSFVRWDAPERVSPTIQCSARPSSFSAVQCGAVQRSPVHLSRTKCIPIQLSLKIEFVANSITVYFFACSAISVCHVPAQANSRHEQPARALPRTTWMTLTVVTSRHSESP
jgi:hypothetical protein